MLCLGTRLKVNIMSYDYCGYGQSSGKPTEGNLNRSCAVAYEKLRERYGVRPEQVILYGQSIGTGKRYKMLQRNTQSLGNDETLLIFFVFLNDQQYFSK